MQKVLICLDHEESDREFEAWFDSETQKLVKSGYEVKVTTTDKSLELIEQYAPHLLILLIALGPDSPAWRVTRHLREGKGAFPSLSILVVARGLPDNLLYYLEPEFQKLYDSCYAGRDFLWYVERLLGNQ